MAEVDGMTVGEPDGAEEGLPAPFRPATDPGLADDSHICPYLAAAGPDGALLEPLGRPDSANRCTAFGEPQPQSDRQQALVCLTASHVNCPRYLRGAALAGLPPPKAERKPISIAVIGAAVLLAAALAASFGFLLVRGGFELPIATPGASQVAIAATPSPAPSPTPAPTNTPTASPSPSASAAPSIPASPVPSPTPSETVAPTPSPTPAPSSDRFALLTQCPGTPNCWIYTIRSGDNLRSIVNWFGVSYDTVRAMNPHLSTPIHAGDKLRIPRPTR